MELIKFLQENFTMIIAIALIILVVILSDVVNKKVETKKNRILIKTILVTMAILSVIIIPYLLEYQQEKIEYNANKPIVLIDIHQTDPSFAELYNIPKDKITYWVSVQNTGNSSIEQLNLYIYFNGFMLNHGELFRAGVNDIKEQDTIVGQYRSNYESIDYKMHGLVIEGLMPGGDFTELVVVDSDTKGFYYYRMGGYDLQWTWNINGKSNVESNSSIIES